jgi:small-conductance mechanosensitive channel
VKPIRAAACWSSVLTFAPVLFAADAPPADGFPPPRSLGLTIVLITGLALLLAGWFAAVWKTRRAILNRLTLLAVEKTRGITSRRLRSISIRRIIQLARIGTRLGSLALVLAGAVAWITYALEMLPGTRDFALRVERLVYHEVHTLALAAIGTLPGLGVVALIYFGTRIVHEMLNHYFRAIIDGEAGSALFDPVTAETTRRLANLGIWIAAVIIAFPYIPGSHSAAFRGITVLAGLMLSFGSANLVGQFAGGLALIYGRNLRPGEYIEAGGSEGVVETIGPFACSLRTARDEIVVLPHTVVANGLKNYSRGAAGVRIATAVTIGYDAPWRQVRDLLLAAAAATEGVRADPAPAVRQAGLEDFYVSYELLVTPADPRERLALLGRLHAAIQDRFQEAGVQIMSPHYLGDPATPKIPPARPGA